MCIGICIGVCRDVCVDMWIAMWIDMCIDERGDMSRTCPNTCTLLAYRYAKICEYRHICKDMLILECMDMCIDVCLDTCIDMPPRYVLRIPSAHDDAARFEQHFDRLRHGHDFVSVTHSTCRDCDD